MIPFDFPDLHNEDTSKRYHKYGYYDRKNPNFRFEMVFPKDWMMIMVEEPADLPDAGVPVEIGAFHRYEIPNDQNSEILAGMYVTAVRVPSEWTDAKAVEKTTEFLLKEYKYSILQSQEYQLSGRTLKDILLTYDISGGSTYWARFAGFKVKDETRIYIAGEKDILYLLNLHTSEKNYRNFAAEAFYVAKVTLQVIENSK